MLITIVLAYSGMISGQYVSERGLVDTIRFTPWEAVDGKARDKFLANLAGKTEAERELIRKVIDERRGPPAGNAAVEGRAVR